MRVEYERYVDRLASDIYITVGQEFNLNSPIQLSEVLFEKLKLPVKGIKKTTRGYSTGVKELEKLKALHPVIPKMMEYREASKLLSTYILPLPQLADVDDRVHTTFTQNVTATGRLSSLNPNLQNIPTRTEEGRKIRGGFVASDGKVLVSADYAQFELRLAAAMSGDEKLIEDFNSGVDIHTKTAAEVFGVSMDDVTKEQRRLAKVVNFGIIYGMSAKGLSDATGMSIQEAKEFEQRYFELRKPIADKLKSYLEQAREKGYVETYFGRRRPTPDVRSANFLVSSGGETARMALCRILMKRYELLILDEPTAAMDMESTLAAEGLIRRYCTETGCGVLLITHSISQARRIADRVIVLHQGRLIEQGESVQVLSKPKQEKTKSFLEFYGL